MNMVYLVSYLDQKVVFIQLVLCFIFYYNYIIKLILYQVNI